jgi:hypothetical protein
MLLAGAAAGEPEDNTEAEVRQRLRVGGAVNEAWVAARWEKAQSVLLEILSGWQNREFTEIKAAQRVLVERQLDDPRGKGLEAFEAALVEMLLCAGPRPGGDIREQCGWLLENIGIRRPRTWIMLTLAVENGALPLSIRIRAIRLLLPEGRDSLVPSLRRLLADCPEGEEGRFDRLVIEKLLATWDTGSPQRKKAFEEMDRKGLHAYQAMVHLVDVRHIDASFLPHLVPLLNDDTKLDIGPCRTRDVAAYCIARILGQANPVKEVVAGNPEADSVYHLTTGDERSKIEEAARSLLERGRNDGK